MDKHAKLKELREHLAAFEEETQENNREVAAICQRMLDGKVYGDEANVISQKNSRLKSLEELKIKKRREIKEVESSLQQPLFKS
ncbi:hypothetical protein HUW51_16995 [Adhaeribacter swui]|uniref:Uncharacterized protein n=1 Tax=Adhaeribacter swui TaxID=2086471 RepID=A0A7G7GB01_9BACT|nr:hypothetical protein [Adhaeribacter swui]QNF34335.1 hypothetical protein HUW51_16995 [Adhaeribacter swui]